MGEIMNATAMRLIRWGCSEGQAMVLSQHMTLTADSTPAACQRLFPQQFEIAAEGESV